MDSDKPLSVRCAEALGDRQDWPGATPPPYGDDTPEGWACTGPLIGRFDLCLCVNLGEWSVYDAEEGHDVGLFDSASKAVAEWVVRYGKEESRGK